MNLTAHINQESSPEAPIMNTQRIAAHLSQISLLKWVIPATAGGRRTLNILLLSVVLPGLLLGLGLVHVFTASPSSSMTENERNGIASGHALQEEIQSVDYLAVSSIGPAASLTPPSQVATGASTLTVSIVAPALALIAVLLAALAGGLILKSHSQARPQSATMRPQVTRATESVDNPGATTQEVSQRLVAIQESVRRDMADYLHGHVQSKLLALSMSLGICQKLLPQDPANAYQLMERIQTELQRVQDEDLRQVSRELYPAIIKMGLAPAIRSLISRFSDSIEIDLIIDANILDLDAAGEAKLPEKQRLGIYRIAEEALNNVLKHAKAEHIEVSLLCESSDQIVLSVIDDGRGFDPLGLINCHGLVMMSDYAEAIGGKAEINSSIGQGASVRLIIPLKSPSAGDMVIVDATSARLS